ncbi:unnamed protein product [Fraxinus pennsylvanica]|uniref:MLO-like protein n=1 Tax=Fraxinus pennsylvanica TaxID=56036 RepID=A0AAD1ZXN5_9LAMI|nr:unnamed protein product [Fraxinus pennsylvanica]
MAMQVTDKNTVIRGTPLVQPNNQLFWFNRPQLVLPLLHFTLFMNAFEFAFFIWVTWQFGIKSCYHENVEIIVIRVVLAVMVQVLCSYITLPLYALVTQMGSQYKSAILEQHTVHVIKQWHADVKHKRKQKPYSQSQQDDSTTSWSNSKTPSPNVSYHQRTPTLAEFTSSSGGHHEITEEHQEQEDQNEVDMGSQYKSAILEQHTAHVIKQWHADVKHKRKQKFYSQSQKDDSTTSWSNSKTPSPNVSYHQRTPTLAEFTSRSGGHDEITEEHQEQEDQNEVDVRDEISISPTEVQKQVKFTQNRLDS